MALYWTKFASFESLADSGMVPVWVQAMALSCCLVELIAMQGYPICTQLILAGSAEGTKNWGCQFYKSLIGSSTLSEPHFIKCGKILGTLFNVGNSGGASGSPGRCPWFHRP